MEKYCYLASVYDGENFRVVKIAGCRNVNAGDLIRLVDDTLGEVTHVIFTEIDGTDYTFIAGMKPIEDDWIEHYRYCGRREVSNVSA